jgi:hypothetical protein
MPRLRLIVTRMFLRVITDLQLHLVNTSPHRHHIANLPSLVHLVLHHTLNAQCPLPRTSPSAIGSFLTHSLCEVTKLITMAHLSETTPPFLVELTMPPFIPHRNQPLKKQFQESRLKRTTTPHSNPTLCRQESDPPHASRRRIHHRRST